VEDWTRHSRVHDGVHARRNDRFHSSGHSQS
jgi:hypothetical protein